MFTCPVCYYEKMPDPASDYNICPCCGTEFGNDDQDRTHAQLREYWISSGAKWFYRDAPETWNPWLQLAMVGVKLPYSTSIIIGGSIASSSVANQRQPSKVGTSKKYDYLELAEAA